MRPARTAGRSSQWNRGLQQIQFFAWMKKTRLKRASKHNRQTRNRQLAARHWSNGVMEKAQIPNTPIVHHSSSEVSIWSSSASRYTESGSPRLGAETRDWFAALRYSLKAPL